MGQRQSQWTRRRRLQASVAATRCFSWNSPATRSLIANGVDIYRRDENDDTALEPADREGMGASRSRGHDGNCQIFGGQR